MKMRKLTLVVAFITIALMTSTAQAGALDWFIGNNALAERAQIGSFDQVYALIADSTETDDDTPAISTNANAVIGMSIPVSGNAKATRKMYTVQVSGYSSEVAQTDSSPFITAANTHVRDGVVAANMFPFGTVIKISKLYGNKIFVVEDRMNMRYQRNVDIWFADKADALELGRRTVQIEVIR